MVEEKVLKNLEELLGEDLIEHDAKYYSTILYAMTAVSREWAKKPIKDDHIRSEMGCEYHDWICPTCKSFLAPEPAFRKIKEICPKCGQRLNIFDSED